MTTVEIVNLLRAYALPKGTTLTWTVVDGTGVVEVGVWNRNGYTFIAADTRDTGQTLEEKIGAALRRLS